MNAPYMPGEMCNVNVAVGAVVHEHARIQQSRIWMLAVTPGVHGEAGGPAALAGDCVEVDVVRVGVAGEVGQGDVHDTADAAAQHRSGGTTYDLGLSRDTEAPHLGRHFVKRGRSDTVLRRPRVETSHVL